MTPPILCGRHNDGTLAAWRVTAPGRSEVVCGGHLTASETWARKAGPVRIEPVTQPDGAQLRTPPGDPQPGLFDGDGS